MAGSMIVLPGGKGNDEPHTAPTLERMFLHFRNVNGSVLQDALDTWGDLWNQLQGSVTHGTMIENKTQEVVEPKCGWPEFLEKMWLLKHYLEYAKRFSEGKG